jgi:electron transport complex protein RnfB
VSEGIPINRCPPGGAEGIERLARITGQPATALDPVHGQEAPRSVVWIDEAWCIGCTLCLKVCPTDAIVGTNKRMHTVIEAACTGCELCIPACPVDCIELELVSGERTGWQAWSPILAQQARTRYEAREQRLAVSEALIPGQEAAPGLTERKHDIIAAALAKAKMAQKSHKKE